MDLSLDEVVANRERKILQLVARLQPALGDQPFDVVVIDPTTLGILPTSLKLAQDYSLLFFGAYNRVRELTHRRMDGSRASRPEPIEAPALKSGKEDF